MTPTPYTLNAKRYTLNLNQFDTPATGQKEPPEYDESREYYDDQNKDDPNGLWGEWRLVWFMCVCKN